MKDVQRICCVCRTKKSKKELTRIVKNNETFTIDNNKKLSGKATYVCNNQECKTQLIKKKYLNRTFKTNVNDEIYANLLQEFTNCK